MMESSRSKSSGGSIFGRSFQRSISPSGRFCSSTISSSSSPFISPTSGFSSMARSASPTTVSLHGRGCGRNASSVSFSFSFDHRETSPGRSITSTSSSNGNGNKAWSDGRKKTCSCSPTTHPGSFRCGLHRNAACARNGNGSRKNGTVSYHSHRLHARRSAMTNSLVRIGTVEGDLVQRALAALIRPSSHQQRRRGDFQPRPSRLSVMSKAGD